MLQQDVLKLLATNGKLMLKHYSVNGNKPVVFGGNVYFETTFIVYVNTSCKKNSPFLVIIHSIIDMLIDLISR